MNDDGCNWAMVTTSQNEQVDLTGWVITTSINESDDDAVVRRMGMTSLNGRGRPQWMAEYGYDFLTELMGMNWMNGRIIIYLSECKWMTWTHWVNETDLTAWNTLWSYAVRVEDTLILFRPWSSRIQLSER